VERLIEPLLLDLVEVKVSGFLRPEREGLDQRVPRTTSSVDDFVCRT
jgi:hypothetical protein